MWNGAHYRSALISRLLHVLYPSRCPMCSARSDRWQCAPICDACWSLITPYTGPSCTSCGLPLASIHANVCCECLRSAPFFSNVLVYGLYEGVLAEAIHQFKFSGIRRLAYPLASFLLQLEIPRADCLVAVPMSKKDLLRRGFNHSLLLAYVISKKTGIPLVTNGLMKVRETPPQVGLSAGERQRNLSRAFAVRRNLENLHLILVDDVITTGATVNECSRALREAGVRHITVLALARAPLR